MWEDQSLRRKRLLQSSNPPSDLSTCLPMSICSNWKNCGAAESQTELQGTYRPDVKLWMHEVEEKLHEEDEQDVENKENATGFLQNWSYDDTLEEEDVILSPVLLDKQTPKKFIPFLDPPASSTPKDQEDPDLSCLLGKLKKVMAKSKQLDVNLVEANKDTRRLLFVLEARKTNT